MRLKLIRNGYQAYEYLKFLSENGKAAFASGVEMGLFPESYDTSRTGQQVDAALAQLQTAVGTITG
jgi:hypothetical protein